MTPTEHTEAVSAVAHAIAPLLGVDLTHEPGSMAVKDVWQRAEMFVAAMRAYHTISRASEDKTT
jgi:hypothetical protein